MRGPSFSPTAAEMIDHERLLKNKANNQVIKEDGTETESDDSDLDDDSASDLDPGQRQTIFRAKKSNYRPASKVIDYDDIML